MKNTTKYAGLVAAALLAVAPIAAPVATATLAEGNGTAQAATTAVPYFVINGTNVLADQSAPSVLAQTYDTSTSGTDILTAVFAQAKKQLYSNPVVQAYFVNKNGVQQALQLDPDQFNPVLNATNIAYAEKFKTAGTYYIPFTVVNPETGDKGSINVTVTILSSTKAPYIVGADKVYVKKGASFDPTAGVGFYENSDNLTNLGTSSYSIDQSKLNLNVPGHYVITYTVKNTAGLTRVLDRSVTVTGDTVPAFSYKYDNNTTKSYANGTTVALNSADAKLLTFKTNVSFNDITAALKSFAGANSNLSASYTHYEQPANTASTDNYVVKPDLSTNFNSNDAVRNVISSTANDATYNIPVTVQNDSGDKVSVNVPVVIGTPNALTQTNKSQVVYIKSGVTAQLYSDKATTQAISGRTLSASSAWQSPAVVTDASGKVVAYNLGGNQYVKASDVETTPQDNVSYQVKTQTIYVGNKSGAQLYSDPTATKAISGRDNLAYASAWVSYKEVYNNGTLVAYNLGGDQYVKAEDVTTTKPSGDQGQAVSGVFTISVPNHPTWGTAFYNDSLQAKGILPAASKWRVFSIKTLSDGKQYYNLGGNQWIRADYGRLTK
ncbi:DUF5011 domain-containing protein [Schleiferilactobacillus harbinensis]|uniref:DUF5011 domain-containing protein n=1 Tax=Schleiferilactobacillus harbinensis TaxID=304207 RepID=UPI0021A46372|nr:DUF5011 domain-containing protein [Schleiferilactobacillus harbinensis]MCT2907372.1 DUF5011 domain-containing protein [Schleiferilactobacillus harbinensis]